MSSIGLASWQGSCTAGLRRQLGSSLLMCYSIQGIKLGEWLYKEYEKIVVFFTNISLSVLSISHFLLSLF